jgi:formate dehydrogenase subunit gamma
MRRVRVARHALGFRLLHWLIVVEGVILGLSGIQLGGLGLRIFPEGGTWAIHVLTGIAWIFTSLVLLYYMVVSGDYRWFGIRRIPYAFRYLVGEARAWFGLGGEVGEPIAYDLKRGEYREKIVPTEVIVWWVFVIFGLLLMLSGLEMAFSKIFSPLHYFFDVFKYIFGGGPYSIARSLHRLSLFILLGVFVLHVYAVIIFRMLRGIIFGDREEPVVE